MKDFFNNAKMLLKEKSDKDKLELVFYIFSPTLFIASVNKYNKSKMDRASIIKNFNVMYLVITCFIIAILFLCTVSFDGCNHKLDFIKNDSGFKWFCISLCFYAFFRTNEIFISFVRDAKTRLSPQQNSSGLKYYERIGLAMTSYFELILLYAILQFTLSLYGKGIESSHPTGHIDIWNAIYFSGITIATIGYGDFSPISLPSQFFAIYEVINGFILIVVSFTIYVSLSIVNEEYKKNNSINARIRLGEQSGFVAECVELPIVTQGQTLDEVTANLREAISLHFEGEDLAMLGFAPNPPIVVNYEMAAVCQS